jgi:hypothetical protein
VGNRAYILKLDILNKKKGKKYTGNYYCPGQPRGRVHDKK